MFMEGHLISFLNYPMKLLMVVNEDRFFLSHRKEIAVAARQQGWNVTIACKDTGRRQEVEALGLRMVELPINPTGMNLQQELGTLTFLYSLYRRERPDVVHHVGLKTMLWGGLAARLTGVRGVVNALSGLGTMFTDGRMSVTAREFWHCCDTPAAAREYASSSRTARTKSCSCSTVSSRKTSPYTSKGRVLI